MNDSAVFRRTPGPIFYQQIHLYSPRLVSFVFSNLATGDVVMLLSKKVGMDGEAIENYKNLFHGFNSTTLLEQRAESPLTVSQGRALLSHDNSHCFSKAN